MILTPTYYVFKMYKDHQENTLLGSFITTPNLGGGYLPQIQESASIREDGTIVSTIVNTQHFLQITDADDVGIIREHHLLVTGRFFTHKRFSFHTI